MMHPGRRGAMACFGAGRRSRAGFLLAPLMFGIVAGFCTEAAAIDQVNVTLDRAKLLKLPPHVETIVVGNPIIADVTMMKSNGLVVVTGKGFGETNLIFLDNTGQALSEALVRVEPGSNLVTVQRGTERESYSCSPRCEPAVSLGDSSKFMSETTGQITSRNNLAVGKN